MSQLKLALEDRVVIRLREVRVYFPNVTPIELHKWEEAGLIKVMRSGPRRHRWYYVQELRQLAQIGSNQSKT